MSRWDALRPERHRERPAVSSSNRRQRTAAATTTTSSALCCCWQVQVKKLEVELKNGGQEEESAQRRTLESLHAILKSQSADNTIPPQSLGDTLVLLLLLVNTHNGVVEHKRLELACKILMQETLLLTNRQAKQCVSSLIASTTNESYRIECLARLVLVAYQQLPAEETAHSLINDTLLPALEKDDSHNVAIILQALQCLLQDSLHASALLAPLTVDVTAQGQEETAMNPIRNRIIRALLARLHDGPHSHSACVCLTTVIQASSESKDDAAAAAAADEIDWSVLERFLYTALQNTKDALGNREMQKDALELLRVVLTSRPFSSTTLSSLLFIGNRSLAAWNTNREHEPCLHCCRYQSTSPLLNILHDDDMLMNHVLPCMEVLLQSMPLNLWLGTGESRFLQHFGKQTSDALQRLMRVLQCKLQQQQKQQQQGESSTPAILCPLIQTLLSRIPFSDDESDVLTSQAIQLLHVLSLRFERGRIPELTECLVNCMGGRPRPQGGLTNMSIPMRRWLMSSFSLGFREYLWTCVESRDAACNDSVQVQKAMIRTLPTLVVGDQERWKRFQQVISSFAADESQHVRLDGVTLLESLLVGRSETEGAGEAFGRYDIAIFASSIALSSVNDQKPQIRIAGMKCYGSLLTRDWLLICEALGEDGEIRFWLHVNAILSHCVRPNDTGRAVEPNASVRSAACKSIGDVCTQYLSTPRIRDDTGVTDDEAKEFCRVVCGPLLEAMQDSSAAVRNMAVFAVGNLAHVLRDNASTEVLIPPRCLQPLLTEVYSCLLESNEKLCGNAIRTIGHLVSLSFHSPYKASGALNGWGASLFYRNVLRYLGHKVLSALSSESCSQLTWKQRSVAKKHGWGACNGLALVLDCDEATTNENLICAHGSLQALVQCIEHFPHLNEKVSLSASIAFRKISGSRLSQISSGSGLVGKALALCILQLHQTKLSYRAAETRLANELELLLQHLLSLATICDVCHVLKHDDVEQRDIDFLYEWMVERDVPLNSFEPFALALQRKDLMDDVSLQQKFASRALQFYNKSPDDDITDAVDDLALRSMVDNDTDLIVEDEL